MKQQIHNILEEAKSGNYKLKPYTVVFDVDDTLLLHWMGTPKLKRELVKDNHFVTYVDEDGDKYLHMFLPHYSELLMSLVSWHWNVTFFSAGAADRINTVIFSYLRHILSHYTDTPVSAYEILVKSGQFKILSQKSLIDNNHLISERREWEAGGEQKKDLRLCAKNVEDAVIVEDDRSYVIGTQYPFLGLSYTAASNYKQYLHSKNDDHELPGESGHSVSNNAFYVMGALLKCKKLLDDGACEFLREALDIVCQKPKEKWNITDEEDLYYCQWGGPNSKWFLRPETNFDREKWIETGKEFIQSLLQEDVKIAGHDGATAEPTTC